MPRAGRSYSDGMTKPATVLDAQMFHHGVRAIVNAIQAVAYATLANGYRLPRLDGDDGRICRNLSNVASDHLEISDRYLKFTADCMDHPPRPTDG